MIVPRRRRGRKKKKKEEEEEEEKKKNKKEQKKKKKKVQPRFRCRDTTWSSSLRKTPGKYCAQSRFRFRDRHDLSH